MADAKIEIKVGEVSFVGEGTETWLAAQLEKVIKHLPDLVKVAPSPPPPPGDQHSGARHPATQKPGARGTLAEFMSAHGKGSQPRKFLATAVWLDPDENKRLTTRDVSDALKNARQSKLTNPAQSLNDNVRQGLCEKDGKQFYVTDKGRADIG
jgi:hypothetical protein